MVKKKESGVRREKYKIRREGKGGNKKRKNGRRDDTRFGEYEEERQERVQAGRKRRK